MCGDSTSAEEIAELCGAAEIDLLLTDPPYNVAYVGSTKKQLKIQNDNQDNESFLKFLIAAFTAAHEVMKDGAAFYIFYAQMTESHFFNAANQSGLEVKQIIIWVKNHFVLSRSDYHWKHEPALYGWKEGAAHYFVDDRKQSTVIEDAQQDFRKMKKGELVEILEKLYGDSESTTIIREDKPAKSEEHPTMKPIKLMARLIRNSSRPGETVLDPFGGSGSTLIACEQTDRTCYMMELDPVYCDVIVKRWEKFTGGNAVRICGNVEK